MRPLPSSMLRFVATLRHASFVGCYLPHIDVAQEIVLPQLKYLVLCDVGVSKKDMELLLFGRIVLESLQLQGVHGFSNFSIDSASLRMIGLSCWWNYRALEVFSDLVIEYAPCLERLIVLDPAGPTTIKVVDAPRLTMLGYAATESSRLAIGPVVVKVWQSLFFIFLLFLFFFFFFIFVGANAFCCFCW